MYEVFIVGLALAADPLPTDHAAQAKAFVEAMHRGDFTAAAAPFDAAMQKAMPAEKLKDTWTAIVKQVGAYKETVGTRAEKSGKYETIFVTCAFEKAKLDIRVAFDHEHKIAGLGFAPSKPPVEFKSADYVLPGSFREQPVTLNADGEWPLGGILCMPKGDGPFPAVVFVHGSGAHDRDETLGPNMPFRDIAEGLASRGIASLRYDKRNFVHAAKIKVEKFKIHEEVIEDAIAAVELLRRTPGIDCNRVSVLGHSLGAMAAPKIAASNTDLAGIIIMAGAARPLEDVVIEQLTYISTLPGKNGEGAKEMLPKMKEQMAKLKDPKQLAEMPDTERPFGMPAGYWLSVRELEPAPTAGKLNCRVLVLHGDRDYQVTLDDYALFEKALAGKSNATLRRFANLNHLFMDGKGKATPEEYQKAGHVDKEVIETIAAWVKGS
jgi:dienelactone hydrolase